jgi:hypothetical protein
MSERGDIWLSRGFSVTCILSAFIGALMVGMLLGEPDVLMLFGAVGGVMVGAVFYFVVAGVMLTQCVLALGRGCVRSGF